MISDESVAPRHAEVVVTDDGRFYLTDCASPGGTWRRIAWQDNSAAAREQDWELLRQAFVRGDEKLRFGQHLASLDALFAALVRKAGFDAGESGGAGGGGTPRPRGRVERDPLTGQIIRKRPS